jgi:CRP/FNR family transcriptional regulator, cyclic AMP receptor protein
MPMVNPPFLSTLGKAEVAALINLGTERRYPARSTLFRQGEAGGSVLLLQEGWVKTASAAYSGEEALLAFRGPGDVLGEFSALDGRPRSATVSALVPVRAIMIDGDRFVQHLMRHRRTMHALLVHTVARLRQSDVERLKYVSVDGFRRTARLLLDLAERHGRATPTGTLIDLPLTQRELATAAATSREVAARSLRLLRERGVVETRRQQIVLVHPEVLESMCEQVPDGG